MQWSLFLLLLMGQCFFVTCHLYEYHFIEENKIWKGAQHYCRKHYTDLAKVFDMEDMRRLNKTVQKKGEAWIGLYNNPEENRTWHWSLPGVEYAENKSNWNQSERTETQNPRNCGRKRDKWADVSCACHMWFLCYDGEENSNNNKTLHLIEQFVNWTQAQNYCRHNHTDLASGSNQIDGEEFENLKNSQKKPMSVWIGLFRDSWRWSDGSNFSFRHWDIELFNDEQNNKTCAMTLLNRSGKWSSDDCNKTKPFFCYDDKVILIKENKTWKDALYHCRKNYHDLVSIINPHQQRWVEERAKRAESPYVWLGLHYTCTLGFWFWVTDDVLKYTNRNSTGMRDGCDMSGAMDRGGQQKWFSKPDNEQFNFICSKN